MRVTIKLAPTADPQTLRSACDEAGISLEPMHPETLDGELRTWFQADVDDDRVDEVLERLRGSSAIESAYVKPPDAAP